MEDLKRCFGLTETEVGPEMTMGLCWIDRDRIRSVVARPKICADAFEAVATDNFVSFSSLMSGNELVESWND